MKNFFDCAASGRPHPRANTSASRAISVRLNLPSGHNAAWIFDFSAGEAMYPPARSRAAIALSYTASTRITEFSDEQEVELSKILEAQIFFAASSRSAVSSTITGTLPV